MNLIFGLDEVGRGSFAGPLVAAAVSLPPQEKDSIIRKIESESDSPIRDSKKLTYRQRRRIFDTTTKLNISTYIASISAREINQKGIGWANKQIFKNLINQITKNQKLITNNFQFIIDGNLKISLPGQVITSLPKADATYPEVSLASIIAKVTRDIYMQDLHIKFPHYGFNTNMGYGTLTHRQALVELGPCPHHRTLFVSTSLKNLAT